MILVDDSVSSAPHIFVDLTDNSSTSAQERPTTPHMFLSYASPERNISQTASGFDESGNLSGNMSKRVSSSSTPHLFLNYAGGSKHLRVGGVSYHRTNSEEIRSRFAHWGETLRDFEEECDVFLRANQGLTYNQATTVASTLSTAVQESTNFLPEEMMHSRNMLFASFLSSALEQNSQIESWGHNSQRTNDSTQSSFVGEDGTVLDSLKRQLHQQNEEIHFLRAALKAMIHAQPDDDTPIVPEQRTPQDPNEMEADIINVPYTIEIPTLMPINDEIVPDHMSELTPSDLRVNRTVRLQSRKESTYSNADIVVPGIVHAVPVNQNVSIPNSIPSLSLDFGENKLIAGRDSSYAANYMEAMKLVYRLRTQQHSGASFTDMAKGEIQPTRARGMQCEIFFECWGVALIGRYSGMVRNDLPNGKGVLRFDNRDYYIGDFKDGALHGQGSLFLRREQRLLVFRGNFERNEFVGWDQPSSGDEIGASAA